MNRWTKKAARAFEVDNDVADVAADVVVIARPIPEVFGETSGPISE